MAALPSTIRWSVCCTVAFVVPEGITQRLLVELWNPNSLLAAQVLGWTPLGIACNRGRLEVAVALIRRGAGVSLLLVCVALCVQLLPAGFGGDCFLLLHMKTACCAETLSLTHSRMAAAPCGLLVKLDTLPL
jgi:hypothetical protein